MNHWEQLVNKHWNENKEQLIADAVKAGVQSMKARYINFPVIIDEVIDMAVYDTTLGKFTHYEITVSDDDNPIVIEGDESHCYCDKVKTIKVKIC